MRAASPRVIEAGVVAILVTVALYPLTQVYQVAADRGRGDRTFGAVYGPRGCFLLSILGALAAAPLLADFARRYFSRAEGVVLAAAVLIMALILYAWSKRFDPAAVARNYDRVMTIGYATAGAFAALILWHMAR